MRTSRFTFALILSSLLATSLHAERRDSKQTEEPKAPLFCGVAVMADLAGPVMKAVDARFSQMECAARLNFRDRYFPIAELGIGECDREGEENENHFETRAPYFRVGMDYNFGKTLSGNRFFAGIRYAFSSFNFDFENPEFSDPVYTGGTAGLSLKDQKARMQWAELCIGCETKLWSFIRLGWTLRYKFRISQKDQPYGSPYYVPGFGKNGNTVWGGTCCLVFDVGKTSKRNRTNK